MKKAGVWLLVVTSFVVPTVFASSAGSAEGDKVMDSHVYKFSRGIVNMGTAPVEIPKQMIKKAQDGETWGGQLAGYLTGAITGVGWTFWRFGSGFIDVCSAPFPGNEKGKIAPEFVTDEFPLQE